MSNALFVDVDEAGRPIDRLRALFGPNIRAYDEMMKSLSETNHW